MNKKFNLFMILFTIFILVFTLSLPQILAEEDIIYVDKDYFGTSDGTAEKPYRTIQSAINCANEGDIIYIYGGLYEQKVALDINKKVKIVGGIDQEDTIIYPKYDMRYLIEITADEVEVDNINFSDLSDVMESPIGALMSISTSYNKILNCNFTVQKTLTSNENNNPGGIYFEENSKDNLISRNYFNNTKTGLWLYKSTTNDIAKNNIFNSTEFGVLIDSSTENNRLYGNIIDNSSETGIKIKDSYNTNFTNNSISNCGNYGIHSLNNYQTNISKNTIYNCTSAGIYLSSSKDIIQHNILELNTKGIWLIGDNNFIYNNTIIKSYGSGIYSQSSSNENDIIMNKFRANSKSAIENGDNNWYIEKTGNYWSDYTYVDFEPINDTDGIGDIPYEKNGVYDKYPLGYFLKPPLKPNDPSPKDLATDVSLNITLGIYVKDNDSKFLNVTFYNADDDSLIKTKRNPITWVPNSSRIYCNFKLGFNTTYAWYVVADDGLFQNRSDIFFLYTAKTPNANDIPIAKVNAPIEVEALEEIKFDGSGSYDPDGEIDFYRWNFGDATSEILQMNTTHIFEEEGIYTVKLTVIDNFGAFDTENITINVKPNTNYPPEANISTVSKAFVKESVNFISSSTDPDGDELNCTWIVENKTYYGNNINHVFNSPGEYIVFLEVNDGIFEDETQIMISIKYHEKEETPGFELFIFIISTLVIFLVYNRKKNK